MYSFKYKSVSPANISMINFIVMMILNVQNGCSLPILAAVGGRQYRQATTVLTFNISMTMMNSLVVIDGGIGCFFMEVFQRG